MIHTPQELEVWYILPTIRRELANAMRRHGLKQKQIAVLLSITEAAVSNYVSAKRAKDITFTSGICSYINHAARRIIEHPESLRRELFDISQYVKQEGAVCSVHRTVEKGLSSSCRICFEQKR